MKTLKKIVFTGLLALIACAGVAQAQELYKDEKAPIFKTAHYCLVGDLYEVIPQLIQKIEEKKGA